MGLFFIFLLIPVNAFSQNSSDEISLIPSWIKNNAGWWADGILDDDSFIQGIQYLISKGIIQMPSIEPLDDSENNLEPPIVIEFSENSEDNFDHQIIIQGTDPNYKKFWIVLLRPDGSELKYIPFLEGTNFSTFIFIKSNDPLGEYEVIQRYEDGDEKQLKTFSVVNPTSIPSWIKNNAEWWANDIIDDSDFISGIQFMIKSGILKIPVSDNMESILVDIENSKISPLLKNYSYQGESKNQKVWGTLLSFKTSNSNLDQSLSDYELPYTDYDIDYDKEVQYALSRADVYAKQSIAEVDKYAKMWINGQISYDEYEIRGMQVLDYYGNQYVNEMESYWNSKYENYP